jgi:O-antigen ligase
VPLLWPSRLLPAGALLVWALAVSFPAAIDQGIAIKPLLGLAASIVLVALIWTVCRDLRDVRLLLGVLVAVAVFISANALLGAGSTRVFYSGAVVEGRAQGLFIEPNELGSFCSMAALVAVGLALGAGTARRRLYAGLALVVILGALALSLSRGAWLGTLVGFALLLVTVTQARRAVLLLAVPLLAATSFLNVFLPENPQVQVLGERARVFTKLDQPYEGRPAIWAEAMRQIHAEPVTGSGPENFGVASRRLAATGQTVYTGHAHNLYLNTAAELGLTGLALLLVFFGALASAARGALKRLRRLGLARDRAVVAGVAAALLSFAVQGLTNTFTGNPILDATVWSLAGFVLVAHRGTRPAPGEQT